MVSGPNLFEIPFLQDLVESGLERQGGWYVSPMEAGDAGKDDSDSLPAFYSVFTSAAAAAALPGPATA